MPLLTRRHPGFARTLELSESHPHSQASPRPESPSPSFPNYTAAVTGPLNLNLECKSSIRERLGRVSQTFSSLGQVAPHYARQNFLLKLFCSVTLLSAWLNIFSKPCLSFSPPKITQQKSPSLISSPFQACSVLSLPVMSDSS